MSVEKMTRAIALQTRVLVARDLKPATPKVEGLVEAWSENDKGVKIAGQWFIPPPFLFDTLPPRQIYYRADHFTPAGDLAVALIDWGAVNVAIDATPDQVRAAIVTQLTVTAGWTAVVGWWEYTPDTSRVNKFVVRG